MAATDSTLPDAALLENAQYIDVETDLFHIRIDTTGGDLRQVDLLAYAATTDPDSPPFRLLNDSLPNLFVIQSGLRASVGTEPTHHVVYTPEQTLLVKEARQRNCKVISGVDMFIGQAALKYKYFTDQEAPKEVMRQAFKRAIGPAKL